MELVKYYAPGPRFNSATFSVLANIAGIKCAPMKDDVIIDRDKLNEIPGGYLPAWIQRNKASINSKVCTIQPTIEEIKEAFGCEAFSD